ncbi:MAG TPA: hypothetical protein VFF26_13580 [Gallionella sp.]|nr:hypothetical protein [Gallionella sp.]
MSDAEKAQTHKAIGQLLSLFRESTGMRVREQLAKKYALNGKHAFLELTPVAAYYVLNGAGGRRLDIRASIKKDVATAEVWSVTISVFGQRNETDQAMLDNFSIALIDELAKAGWLN